MELLLRLIDGALDADELLPEEVHTVEVEHCYTSIWYVLLTLTTGTERYSFFDLAAASPYEPYTTFSPYTEAEIATLYGTQQEARP